MTKKDIAIIGGAFDPVHMGHIEMARYLSDNYIVDEIWMMPSYISPEKNSFSMCSYEHRLNMLEIAIKDIKNVSVSNFEKVFYEKLSSIINNKNNKVIQFDKNNKNVLNDKSIYFTIAKKYKQVADIKTYTIDVLSALKEKYINTEFHFVIGMDNAMSIKSWHNYKELLNNNDIYIFDRELCKDNIKEYKYKIDFLNSIKNDIQNKHYYEILNKNIISVSSSELRDILMSKNYNDNLFSLIDINVFNYINNNKLYV